MDLLDLMVKIGVDDQASGKVDSIGSSIKSKLGSVASAAGKAVAAGVAAIGTGAVAMGKSALQAYSTYEQMVGGVDKLYGSASARLQAYASQAYQTSGMSANQYMQQATTFSAALINSLGGDTAKAADMADVAMRAMSDNVNVFGSNAEDVQNAIMGISRQNYTMIDNLKLGYAGTKEGMEQLIADANAWGAANGEASDLSIDSFADCVQAIQQIQEKQGIAGTTAKEAAGTIEGSWNMAKAAWEDYLTGIANPDADMGQLTENLLTSIGNVAANVGPRVVEIGEAMVTQFPAALSGLEQTLEPVVSEALAGAWDFASTMLSGVGIQLPQVDASQVSAAIGGVVDAVRGAADVIGPIAQGIVDGLQGMFDGIFGDKSPEEVRAGLDSVHDGLQAVADVVGGGIADGLTAIGDAIGALADAAPVLGGVAAVCGTLAAGFTVLGASIGLVSIGGLVSSIPVVSALMGAWGTVTTAVGDAWAFLSLAMEANPLGVVVVAVAALVAALVYLYNTNETVRDAINGAWQAIQDVVGTVAGAIAGFFTDTLPQAFQAAADLLASLPGTIGGFLESLPGTIGSALQAGAEALASWASGLAQSALDAGAQFVSALGSALAAAPEQVLYWLTFAIAYVVLWAGQMVQNALTAGAQFVSGVVSAIQALPGSVAALLASVVSTALSWAAQMAASALSAGAQFVAMCGSALAALPGLVASLLQSAVAQAVAWASQMASQAASAGSRFVSGVGSALASLPGRVWSMLSAALSMVASFAGQMASRAGQAASGFASSLVSGLASIPGRMASIGSQIISGLVSGITSGAQRVVSALGNVVSSAIDSAKRALGIASPSKVFRQIGDFVMQGMALGIGDGWGGVSGALDATLGTMGGYEVQAPRMVAAEGGSGAQAAAAAYGSAADRILDALPDIIRRYTPVTGESDLQRIAREGVVYAQ
ncbi:MAG: hypothetical protein ACI38Z_05110 [Parafannyhessea sp.]|uniref:phage tail protein n=1 Tax=Parafannyhessea sp. TaxID=2847324 RepID=UPI003EFD65DF